MRLDAGSLEARQVPVCFAAVAAGIVAGLLWPPLARGMELLVGPALVVLMYAMFVQLPLRGRRALVAQPRFIAALLLANFLFVPALVWALAAWLAPDPALLAGMLLVLLTPCIDYVVVFTRMARGDAAALLGATPLLLVLQWLLLPVYLMLIMRGEQAPDLAFAPFLGAFLLFIVLPLGLAWLTLRITATSGHADGGWRKPCAWLPVPAMAVVLLLVSGSRVGEVVEEGGRLATVLPACVAFALLAPLAGMLAARLLALPVPAARAVAFSAGTRNSLVVLPLALALPGEAGHLAGLAVVAQTLVELLAEIGFIRVIPRLIPTT
ncbi:MAG: bile acid:sodium symporter [Pseudomonadota bacterium]|jgi:ACR3 family arsenite transporter